MEGEKRGMSIRRVVDVERNRHGSLAWTVPEEQPFTLTLQIARPTGFVCLEHEESFRH